MMDGTRLTAMKIVTIGGTSIHRLMRNSAWMPSVIAVISLRLEAPLP